MNIISSIKNKYNNFMLSTNSINRLLTQKVEEYILLEELPMQIAVGTKSISVGNFTYDTHLKFFRGWALIISALSAKIINMELTKERKKELLMKGDFDMLTNGKWMMEFLLMDEWLKKVICKLLKKTLLKQQGYILNTKTKEREYKEWSNCSYSYFKKHIKLETLIQICWLIYLYNFDSQKKSLRMVVEKMNINAMMETYIPFWLQNLGGLTGKFDIAQSGNIDSLLQDLESRKNMPFPPKEKSMTNKKEVKKRGD